MKKYIPTALLVFALTGCAAAGSSTVDTATEALATVQKVHAEALTAELIYLNQPPCGLAGSLPAPLCASYAVALQIQVANAKADQAVKVAEDALKSAGTNPTTFQLAIAAAQAAVAEWTALIPAKQ